MKRKLEVVGLGVEVREGVAEELLEVDMIVLKVWFICRMSVYSIEEYVPTVTALCDFNGCTNRSTSIVYHFTKFVIQSSIQAPTSGHSCLTIIILGLSI